MEAMSFEEAYAQLEAVVAALRDGQIPLERALQYFEEGVKLSQYCQELLQKAELRVQQLSADERGEPTIQPLELS